MNERTNERTDVNSINKATRRVLHIVKDSEIDRIEIEIEIGIEIEITRHNET